ncbi:SGNH/GDSL hydrolase family protein [Mucilaginibacter pedocola]|uniref:SGNH hydrolase-type esterase domain-containing protein n=1 Tax=Mucilaginibacter pedocola TaxID=1792845 RepID=A0A1S9PL46_9SPHI|nr:SGNH/GDSL hydrolase family protein [Mucilaginibacter pedocola]OOQ61649.1 hypothetical protein BC343_00810 [Mucilaginibacter pedocola]
MKKLLSFLLAASIFGCKYQRPPTPVQVPQESPEEKAAKALLATTPVPIRIAGKAYFFGDSITEGYNGNIVTADNWVALLAASVGWEAVNLGIGGSTLEWKINGSPSLNSMYVRAVNEIPAKTDNDKYLFFAYGINDVGFNTPDLTAEQFTADYQFVLDKAYAQGWLAKDIVLVNIYYCNEQLVFGKGVVTPGRLAAFNTALNTVAVKNGTRFIDINTFMKTNGAGYLLSADGVHPTNTGYAVIARGVQAALSTFQ